MRTIFKYYFDIAPRIAIEMPQGAIIRHVAMQYQSDDLHGHPKASIWVEVEERAPRTTRYLYAVNTGEEVPPVPPQAFIGTLMYGEVGQYTTHFYDGGEADAPTARG